MTQRFLVGLPNTPRTPGLVLWEHLDATDAGITISGWSGTAIVDPITLALLNVEPSGN